MTEGCSWAQRTGGCKFCGVYNGKEFVQKYRVRPWDSIKNDIDITWLEHGAVATRAFLAGGNALSAPTDLLARTLEYLHDRFPRLQQVSSYAKNYDVLQKSISDLEQLAAAGLTIVYMGLESGSDEVLKYMNKGTTAAGMLRAAKKAMNAGIQLSVYVVLGLGGKIFPDHAKATAKILTEMNPHFIRFRSLNFIPNAPLYDEWQRGEFIELRPVEILQEQLEILENLGEHVSSYILNDHVSNFASIDGRLPENKPRILKMLEAAIDDPRLKSLPHINRTSM
ncbi:MAG TPA: radical SAM protein [Candidatus Lokiarchaeia archaeon]|nr:radical SAM protein [Candidatus Lokiarchaeia archaeon]